MGNRREPWRELKSESQKIFIRNLTEKVDNLFSSQLFSYRKLIVIGLGFLTLVMLAIFVGPVLICWVLPFDYCPVEWPITVFSPRTPRLPTSWEHILAAAIVVILFYPAVKQLARNKFGITSVVIVGLALVFGTNLIQVWTAHLQTR